MRPVTYNLWSKFKKRLQQKQNYSIQTIGTKILSMTLFHPTGCSSPRLSNCYLYQGKEEDSGILSLNSSASSYDFYGSQSKTDHQFEEYWKNKLIRSESRRSALDESLQRANDALQHQLNCLQQQDNGKARLEILQLRQERLESRVSNLQDKKYYQDLMTLNTYKINEKDDQMPQIMFSTSKNLDISRINALESEVNNIKRKMEIGTLKTHVDSLGPILCAERKDSIEEASKKHEEQYTSYLSNLYGLRDIHKKIQEELRHYAQQMEAKCHSAENERDSLELKMTSLQSSLIQAKLNSMDLEKECMKLQSQLLASRNINESLHLEVSSLRQLTQKLEDSVKGSDSEKESLHKQVLNLERENQNLQSQKELLIAMLKRRKGRTNNIEKQNESNVFHEHCMISSISSEENQSLGKITEKSVEASNIVQNLSPHTNTFPAVSSRRSSKQSRTWKRNKGVKYEDNKSLKMQNVEEQRLPVKKHRREKAEEIICNRKKCLQVGNEQENGSACDMMSKSSEISETGTGCSAIIFACYQHLADLLMPMECLLKNNVKLDHEKDHIVKYLVGVLSKLKDAEILTDKSRKEVEQLLCEHIRLRENCHKRQNQITSVVIELKHLRQAYHGIIEHSEDPDDKKAILWISRVQAIKDSLKTLKLQEQKTESMEKENHHIQAMCCYKTNENKGKSTSFAES